MQAKQPSKIEQYVIDKVRDMRKQRGMSQAELAYEIDVSVGFIGKVESNKFEHKYNLNHINEIAKAFSCSPKDLIPDKPLKSKRK